MTRTKTKNKAVGTPSPRTYTVFLGYQFKSDMYDRSGIISAFEDAVKIAEGDLQKSYPSVTLKPEHQFNLGEPINAQINSIVKNAAVAVFELSDGNRNVYFEMGLAMASRVHKPLILVNKKSDRKNVSIASDVKDIVHLSYKGDLDSVVGNIARHIQKQIKSQITRDAKGDEWDGHRKVWFGGTSPREVTIVCPELPPSYQPKYAKDDSPEFVNLAHFGDLDALVEVLTLLPKLLPNTVVKYITSEEVQRKDKNGTLIVIGGPDFNTLTEMLLEDLSFPFKYRQKSGETIFYEVDTKQEFNIQKRGKGALNDYGLFARFPNPWNKSKAIIMIGGLQTFGVLGAVQAFAMSTIGKRNVKKVLRRCADPLHFATLVPVKVSAGQPSISTVDLKTFHTHPWHNKLTIL